MATVEIFFPTRVLTDDRWMDKAACKGLTHLFFLRPAERPQARVGARQRPSRCVASCIGARRCASEFASDQPRVRVLGWRERGRAPRGRLPPDRPDRRASPPQRLTAGRVSSVALPRSPVPTAPRPQRRRAVDTPHRAARRVGRLRRRASDHGRTRSAPTSRPTACTACTSTTAPTSSARCRRTARTSCSSRITTTSTGCATLLADTRFSGMLGPTSGAATAGSSPGTTASCGPCSTTT